MTIKMMLLIVKEPSGLESIITKYDEFILNMLSMISLFNIWEEKPSLQLEIWNSFLMYGILKVVM